MINPHNLTYKYTVKTKKKCNKVENNLSQNIFCKIVGKTRCVPRILARFGLEIGQNVRLAFWQFCDPNAVGDMHGNSRQFLEKKKTDLEPQLDIHQWNNLFILPSIVNNHVNHYSLKMTEKKTQLIARIFAFWQLLVACFCLLPF